MDGGDGSVPIRFVGGEVVPEFTGGEFRRHDYAAAGEEGGEEGGEEAVHVEEGHDEEGAVSGGEVVGVADVF